MKEIINILCATDDNYVPYCGIMLTSVFDSNKDAQVNAYILVDKELSSESDKKLQELAKKYNNKIYYCIVDNSFLEKFPIKGYDYWSIVTYYRLYAEELLPEVDKILYLDCDIIVNGDLRPLWKMDWSNYGVGVVTDICENYLENQRRLQYEKEKGYFNAGVLMINLDYWRKHKIGKQCFDYLRDNYDKIDWNDQDVLNYVLRDCKRALPIAYNFQVQFLLPPFFNTFNKDVQNEILNTKNPIIIHYASKTKPWMINYYLSPFNALWHKYKKISNWKYKSDLFPKHKVINYLLKRYIFWPLGLFNKTSFIKQ